jgi:uncharacterized protein (DUF983 family)
MKKGTKLYSILFQKCPACQEGNLFTHNNPYDLGHLADMPHYCPVCNENFFPEPAFYYGAMFVSYAITVAMSVAIIFGFYLFLNLSLLTYIILNGLILLALFPITFRFSRAAWINIFVAYKGKK